MYSKLYKHYVTGLLLTIYIFNHVDRSIFSFLMEPIKKDFGLSDTELGFVLGPALVLFYATLGIPVARWADRSVRVNIMSGAIALWSVIVLLTATTVRFWQLILARIGVGIGEAGFSAVAMSVIGDYHTNEERTRAIAHFMLAIPIAGVISSLTAGWVSELYGWRAVFLVAGAPGLVLAIVLKLTVAEPPRRPLATSRGVDSDQPPLRAVFSTLWRSRTLRHLVVGQALANVVSQAMGWAPAFFIRNHGMTTGELGSWLAVIGGVGGSTGIWLSGYLATRFGARDERFKVWVMAVAAATVPVIAAVSLWSPSKYAALLALLVTQVPMLFFLSPTSALVQDLSPPTMRATMASVFILIQVMAGGFVGVQLVGVLSDLLAPAAGDSGAGLRWSMTITSCLAFWAAVHFWLSGRALRRDASAGVYGAVPAKPSA